MMDIRDTTLEGVKKIKLDVFSDFRGSYTETYNKELYEEFGVEWVQDDVSVSHRNVLRGIHGDADTYKLISCSFGNIYLVIVDCRVDSKKFGAWEKFVITGDNGVQIFVPPERGVGHLVMSEYAVFSYKQSQYYVPDGQFTYRWDDPNFNIWWPIKNPILSERDSKKKEIRHE